MAGILHQDGVVRTVSTGQVEDQEADQEKYRMINGIRTRWDDSVCNQGVIGVKAITRASPGWIGRDWCWERNLWWVLLL